MTISEIGGRDSLDPLAWRRRLPRDMAVHPFHRVGRGERQRAREHLIERDAERIEVAARIDRAIHPPGLFGRHIGERAGDGLGRLGRLSLARQPRGDAEPGEPHRSVGAVHQDIGGLDVLVDEAALVGLAQRRGDADGEAQEVADLHGLRRAGVRAARRRGPRAPAWCDRLRARAPAAAPPRRRRARSLVRIRGRGDRVPAAAGDPRRGRTVRTGLGSPSAPSRDPRKRTRSPSSHKTCRL